MSWLRRGRRAPLTPIDVPVHQIMFSSAPDPKIPAAAQALRERVGDAHYRLWQLEDARSWIAANCSPAVLATLDGLRPYAYKADLARYCILHHFGGVYADLAVTEFTGFAVAGLDFVGFRDPNNQHTSWKVGNHMFYARAGSPILADSIAECVANYDHRFYGKDPHFPTGPSVLGRALANASSDLHVLMGDYFWLKSRPNKYVLPGHGVVARGKVGGRYLGGKSGVPGGNDYTAMWRERRIYG